MAPTARTRAHSPQSLIEHAMALTQEAGLDAVAVRALARRAGVFPAVIYHHIGDLEAVRAAVCDAVVAEIPIPPRPGDARRAWRPWLRKLADDGYATIRRYPGVYTFIARNGPSSPSQLHLIDETMQVLLGAGLQPEPAALCYGAFISSTGAAADLAAMMALSARHGDPAERLAAFTARLRNVAALHPGVDAALPSFSTWDHDRAFAFGIELLLDGIEQQVKVARRQRNAPASSSTP